MAGDWIKMRTNLWDDPRVSRLCDLTDHPEAMIVGGLYWLWAMADEHTEDGVLLGLTARAIDRKTGVAGLGQALVDIGWLADHPEGVRIVGFEEHNGKSAKRRASDAKRKDEVRNPPEESPQPVREMSARHADKVRTDCGGSAELEKRREEKSNTSPSLRSGERTQARASRQAPRSMTVTPEIRDWVVEKGLRVDVDAELEKFRDHTFKTAISDWTGAFRNWLRRSSEGGAYSQLRGPPGTRAPTAAEQRVLQASPGLAAPYLKPKNVAQLTVFEMEPANVAPRSLDKPNLREADADLRPALPGPVFGRGS